MQLIFFKCILLSASFAIALCLVLLSLIINLIACVTILRHSGLRRSGYFRLHIVFLIVNIIYFVFTCPPRATYATAAILNHLGVELPGSTFLSMYPWLLQANADLLHCLLGLQVYIESFAKV